MGNVLDAPVTEKDTVRFERAGAVPKLSRKPATAAVDDHVSVVLYAKEVEKNEDVATTGAIPGNEFRDGIVVAASSMQGWRCTMEDRLCATMDLEGCPLGVRHLFCLFDGHGGDSVAEYCKQHLADHIVKRLRTAHAAAASSGGSNQHGADNGAGPGPSAVAECVREACREVDAQVKGRFFTPAGMYVAPPVDDPLDVTPPQLSKNLKGDDPSRDDKEERATNLTGESVEARPSRVSSSTTRDTDKAFEESKEVFSTCGTTSLVVAVSDSHVICCNTGDSRAILASEGGSRPLSRDHKPENPDERQRIEAAGGTVEHNRVEGKLAVSRCIGDHPFKSDPSLPMERQMVVSDPEVTVTVRSDADEFVIMACDGVWDVMGNDEACFFLRKCIQDGGRDLGRMLEEMEDACLAKQSMDNMSVLAIAFKAAWEEGLHLHKSARYVLTWGCEEVSRWLSINNFGQYQEEFERHEIDGVGLISLTEGDLHHKLHLKKVGLRKKLWQRLSPLRLGYLAWNKRELIAWLGHVGLERLAETIAEHDIDGRALSTMCKANLRSLAKKASASKTERRRLYDAVGELWDGEGDVEWISFHGTMHARFNASSSGAIDAQKNAWFLHPASRFSAVEPSSSSSSSSSKDSDCASDDGAGGGRDRKRRGRGSSSSPGKNASNTQTEAPVVVGQGSGLRRGSRGRAMSGALRISRVLLQKFENPLDTARSQDVPPGANSGNPLHGVHGRSVGNNTARAFAARPTPGEKRRNSSSNVQTSTKHHWSHLSGAGSMKDLRRAGGPFSPPPGTASGKTKGGKLSAFPKQPANTRGLASRSGGGGRSSRIRSSDGSSVWRDGLLGDAEAGTGLGGRPRMGGRGDLGSREPGRDKGGCSIF